MRTQPPKFPRTVTPVPEPMCSRSSGHHREMPQGAGPGAARAIVAPGFPAIRVKGGRESREVARAVQKFFGVARARSRLHAEAAVSANLALPLLGRAFRMGGLCPALSRDRKSVV